VGGDTQNGGLRKAILLWRMIGGGGGGIKYESVFIDIANNIEGSNCKMSFLHCREFLITS
jgi:hypothetical protein